MSRIIARTRRGSATLRGWGKCRGCRWAGANHCYGDVRGCSCRDCH